MDAQAYLLQLGQAAKSSGFALANLGVMAKNRLLGRVAAELKSAFDEIGRAHV